MTNTLNEKLFNVQQQLNAPKNEYNAFGKFYYRSLDGVLEAIKPLLKQERLILLLDDNILTTEIGRTYVEATAKLLDLDSDNEIIVKAYAREPKTKKGADESQLTGTASTYARKYALNGLFAIDDNEDPDQKDNTGKTPDKNQDKPANKPPEKPDNLQKVIKEIDKIAQRLAKTKEAELTKVLISKIKKLNYNTIEDIDTAQDVLSELKKIDN